MAGSNLFKMVRAFVIGIEKSVIPRLLPKVESVLEKLSENLTLSKYTHILMHNLHLILDIMTSAFHVYDYNHLVLKQSHILLSLLMVSTGDMIE